MGDQINSRSTIQKRHRLNRFQDPRLIQHELIPHMAMEQAGWLPLIKMIPDFPLTLYNKMERNTNNAEADDQQCVSFLIIPDVLHALPEQGADMWIRDAVVDFLALPAGSHNTGLPQAAHMVGHG